MFANSQPSMTAKATNIRDNIWLHQDKPGTDLTVITVATGLVSFIVVLFLRTNIQAAASTLLLVAFVTLVVFLAQSKTTKIEIDREKGAVVKTTNYRLFTTRKSYSLREFNDVKLLTMDEPVEDGYRTIRYSVALSGGRLSLELVSADTESEGRAIQQELSEFLGITGNSTLYKTPGR